MQEQVKTSKIKTVFKGKVINEYVADNLFIYLRDNIEWEDGVKSKSGFTRKAKSLNAGDNKEIDDVIAMVLKAITDTKYCILGIYLNYYENGNMYTPNHSHKDTHQLIISLGGTRILKVGTKNYTMKNGDAIIFGSSVHGVPKDNSTTGRISIATFMVSDDEIIKQFKLDCSKLERLPGESFKSEPKGFKVIHNDDEKLAMKLQEQEQEWL